MSREHDILLIGVQTAIVNQRERLRGVLDDLADAGMDEELRRLRECIAEFETTDHPIDLVRRVVPVLRSLSERLREAGIPAFETLRECATILVKKADRTLTETQPIDDEDKP